MKLIQEQIALPTFSVSPDATAYVAGLLLESSGIEATDTFTQLRAVTFGREIRGHLAEVEAAYRQTKAPLLEGSRLLDKIYKEYTQPLLDEIKRLEDSCNNFQAQEDQRVAQAAAARAAEIEQLQKAEQQARQQAEAISVKSQDGLFESEDSALDDIQAAHAADAAQAAADATRLAIVKPEPEPVRAKGMARRRDVGWKVTDIHALYKARPDLVKLEPKIGPIKECDPDGPAIPGLELWWKNTVSIRK